jgi:hypothetical protein
LLSELKEFGLIEEEPQFLKASIEHKKEIQMFDPEIQQTIQGYVNTFRKKMSDYIDDGVGQEFRVFNFPNGILIDIRQGMFLANNDIFNASEGSLEAAFNKVGKSPEKFFTEEDFNRLKSDFEGGNRKHGTEILIGSDSVIVLKGNDNDLWSGATASSDVESIVNGVKSRWYKGANKL